MIDSALKVRKAKLEKNQNMLVEMKPEFADALRTSLSFSSKDKDH